MNAFSLTPSSLLSKNVASLRNPSLSYIWWFYFCLFLLEQFIPGVFYMQDIQYAEKTKAVIIVNFKAVAKMGVLFLAFPDKRVREMKNIFAELQVF